MFASRKNIIGLIPRRILTSPSFAAVTTTLLMELFMTDGCFLEAIYTDMRYFFSRVYQNEGCVLRHLVIRKTSNTFRHSTSSDDALSYFILYS